MSRPTGRRKVCDVGDARARHDKARQFLSLAKAAEGDEGDDTVRAAEASLLVGAGIAAVDAICCIRLGERSADGSHGAAVELVARVDRAAAKRLQTLLSLETAVQYGIRNPSKDQLAVARRAARALFDTATEILDET
ncbi:MAG: hypothetical protein ACRDZN_16155 [Acidimicrobiales bacterium]